MFPIQQQKGYDNLLPVCGTYFSIMKSSKVLYFKQVVRS